MPSVFNDEKATEAAAYLLSLRGGRMHYLKLLKLLYIADRRALEEWGIPISNDSYVSMDHGPVLSQTYNLIRDGGSRFWSQYISSPFGDYEIALLSERPARKKLSKAEEALLATIFEEFGSRNRWDLVDEVHKFGEWKNPNGSSIPIHLRDILTALGEPAEEIAATLAELGYERSLEQEIAAEPPVHAW